MDHKKSIQSSGQHHHEGHGVHICHKCGWSYPKPHPSARHRRAHKKICGTIEGYNLVGDKQRSALDDDDNPSDDDQSKTSHESLKGVETSITRRTSSGFGSRSSMSTTRSEDDVFSDAVVDFTEASVAAESGENVVADGGKLCSENPSHGSELQATAQYPETEIDKAKSDHSSECLPSSMNDSVSSDLGTGGEGGRITEKVLSSSAVAPSHDFDEMGSKEQGAVEASAELATSTTTIADNIMNAVSSSYEAIRDSLVDPLLQATGRQEIDFGVKDIPCPEVDVEEIKTMESQGVNEANLKQGVCIRSPEENLSNPTEGVRVDDISSDLPVKKQPVIILDNIKDQSAASLTVSSSPDSSDEADILGQDEDIASNEVNSVTSLVNEPDSSAEIKSKDVISDDVESREIISAETVVKEGTIEEVRPSATDLDSHESEIAAVHQLLDNKQDFEGKKFESSEEQKSLTICDDSPETDIVVQSGEVINTVHNEGDDFQFYDCNSLSLKSISSEDQNSLDMWDCTLQNVETVQSVKDVDAVADNDGYDDRDSQSCDDAEDDGKPLGTDKACSQLTDHVASEDDKATNLIGDSEERVCSVEGGVEKEKSYDSEFGLHDKVEVEKSYSHDQVEVGTTDPSSTVEFHDSEIVKTGFQLKNLQDGQEGDPTSGNSTDQTVGKEDNKLVEICAMSSLDDKFGAVQEVKNENVSRVSDSADVQLSDVNGNSSSEHSNGTYKNLAAAASLEVANETHKSDGNEFGIGKVDLGLISDHDDDIDSTKNTRKEVTQSEGNSVSSVQDSAVAENKVTKEEDGTRAVNDSVRIQGDIKHDDIVSALDYQADSSSQTDSLEGNWGSVSVFSAISDVAPATATDTAQPPSQRSVEPEKDNLQPRVEAKAVCDGSDLSGLKDARESHDHKEGASEVEPLKNSQELVDDSLGSKKNKEIIAKVTNWSSGKQHSGKQHMPLKSLLGEPDLDDIPTTVSTDSPAKTDKGVHDDQKYQTSEASRGVGKEWNSPARYPANIKREKSKVRGRPYWAPFICCSSIETS